MLKKDLIETKRQSVDIFALVTAEAWLDPSFARELSVDKAKAVGEFARTNGHPMPSADAIKAFEVAPNPIGDLDTDVPDVTATNTVDEGSTCYYNCPSVAPGCNSSNLCGPNPWPTDGCSAYCMTNFNCSLGCAPPPTLVCSTYSGCP